jgi:hypothetical protein
MGEFHRLRAFLVAVRHTIGPRDYGVLVSGFRFIIEPIMGGIGTVAPLFTRWVPTVLGRIEVIPPRGPLDLYFAFLPSRLWLGILSCVALIYGGLPSFVVLAETVRT